MNPPEPYEIRVGEEAVADLRDRLGRTRWPEQPPGHGWDLGTDLVYARELCKHWRDRYDFSRLERLNALGSARWEGLHFLRVEPDSGGGGDAVVLLHGWPSGPIEYERAASMVAAAGRTAIVPSLPGFAWSEDPGEPLDVAGVASPRQVVQVRPGALTQGPTQRVERRVRDVGDGVQPEAQEGLLGLVPHPPQSPHR